MEDMSRAHGVLLSGRFQESRNNDLGESNAFVSLAVVRWLRYHPTPPLHTYIHISPCRYIRHFNMDGFVVPSFEIKHYRKRKC